MSTKKILVVDDEQTICDSIVKILSRKGYSVDYSTNVEDAIEKINNTSYDLVITDLIMPHTGGMELLEDVKKHYSDIDVVMMTGYPSDETLDKATKLGVSDYIAKPFTPDELVDPIEKILLGKKIEIDKKNYEKEEDIDVDQPFKESEIIKYTSKEFAERLEKSDMPILSLLEKLKKQNLKIPVVVINKEDKKTSEDSSEKI